MQNMNDETKLEQITTLLERMDDDHDGQLKVDDVLKVMTIAHCVFHNNLIVLWFFFQIIEMIGKENVKLSGKQMDEIIALIDKEEYLENEEKIEKALAKSKEQREQLKQQKEAAEFADESLNKNDLVAKSDDSKHILQTEEPPLKDAQPIPPVLDAKLKPKDSSAGSTR